MTSKLLTPEEVAEQLKVEITTIRTWLRNGTLKGVKLGGRFWRIKEETLEEFINQSEEITEESEE